MVGIRAGESTDHQWGRSTRVPGLLPFGLGLIAEAAAESGHGDGLGTLLIFHPVFASALAYLSV